MTLEITQVSAHIQFLFLMIHVGPMEPVVRIVLVMLTLNVYFSSEESRSVFSVLKFVSTLLIHFTDPGSSCTVCQITKSVFNDYFKKDQCSVDFEDADLLQKGKVINTWNIEHCVE
jgi:hypothetical protein